MTPAEALAAAKARLAAGAIAFPIYWRGDTIPPLPDVPATFGYAVFNNEGSGRGPIAYGGGLGNNIYRNRASLEIYVFLPRKAGADGIVIAAAETVAVRLRSWRDGSLMVDSADVIPVGPGSNISVPGLTGPVNNYQCAVAEIELHFDQIG